HGLALLGSTDDPADAEHDLAFDLRAVELAWLADRAASVGRVDQWARAQVLGDRRASVTLAVPERDDALEEPSLRARPDSREPRHRGRVAARARVPAIVACRRRDEDAGIGREQHRDLIR